MRQFRYNLDGSWLKGNTHTHSTISDGRKTIQELGDVYRQAGYDFLCLTDHWVPAHMAPAPAENGLLWISGVELNGEDARGVTYHYVALGDFQGVDSSLSLEMALETVRAQGAFMILAHPFWMGLTFADSERFPVDAVEIYNHVCWRENGKGDGLVFWQHLLGVNPKTLAIACDDTHFILEPAAWQGGWLMVNARECTQPAILTALRAGQYYSSCGPSFKSIVYENERIVVQTSPVQFMRLVGPAFRGRSVGAADGQALTTASFEVPADWAYAYLEIEDHQRGRAWTNTLFLPDEST